MSICNISILAFDVLVSVDAIWIVGWYQSAHCVLFIIDGQCQNNLISFKTAKLCLQPTVKVLNYENERKN